MPTKATYYINAPSFSSATAVFTDSGLTTCAPDGFYSFGGIVRQQVGCNLLPPTSCPSCEFISMWDTSNLSSGSSTTTQVKLPLVNSGSYNFVVNWGDGRSDLITSWNQAETLHTYDSAGTYTIRITGTIIGWSFSFGGDRLKIEEIFQWGCFNHGNQINVFAGCNNLVLDNVTDTLDLTNNTTLRGFFWQCTAITTINNLEQWDVSGITNFSVMFLDCINFNNPINTWDVSNATTYTGLNVLEGLHGMFKNCALFNQPLNNWDLSGVRTINAMFEGAAVFNQDLDMWDVGEVRDFQATFLFATAFDFPLGNWDVKNALQMVQFMDGKTQFDYSPANFDATLIGWAALPSLQLNIVASFGAIKYTPAGQTARNTIIANYGWIINSGGLL
jgi:hypothetical protein